MKLLNNLFPFNDDQETKQSLQTSATFSSSLYSVTFSSKSNEIRLNNSLPEHYQKQTTQITNKQTNRKNSGDNKHFNCSSLLNNFVSRKKSFTGSLNSISLASPSDSKLAQFEESIDEEDWIIVDSANTSSKEQSQTNSSRREKKKMEMETAQQTIQDEDILTSQDIDLIKYSWIPCKKDPADAGVLLFKGLFTKFPGYLDFFPQFVDLDLDNMKENKRLLRHATKVIDTVGFVVDSIGNEQMTNQLNEALVKLVGSHLKRNIGYQEFKNLGVVLLDFICEINNRRSIELKQKYQSNQSSTGDSIDHSSNEDSETMTSTLDRIRSTTTSSTSSSEEDSYQNATTATAIHETNNNIEDSLEEETAKIDPNSLIVAWTRLYRIILDLVKKEEEDPNRV